MRMAMARFPFVKPLETFDFAYQPSIDKKQVQTLASCHFIEHGENVVLRGPPGVGKSHLAIGLGLKAIEQGYRVLFTTAAAMIATLTRALTENRLDDKLKLYTIPRLLIIDDPQLVVEVDREREVVGREAEQRVGRDRDFVEAQARRAAPQPSGPVVAEQVDFVPAQGEGMRHLGGDDATAADGRVADDADAHGRR